METIEEYPESIFSEKSFNSVMNFVKYLSLAFTIIAFAVGIAIYSNDEYSPLEYMERFEKVYEDSNVVKIQDQNLTIKTLFDLKYDHYLNVSASLGGIQKGVIIILVISLMVLIFGAKRIPFFGFTIPDTLIYIVTYFGGLYLLANFGLTFNALIENRLSLHAYIDQLENASGGIHYKNSIRHLLSDSTLGDNWFSHYFDIYLGEEASATEIFMSRSLGWLGLYGIYAVLLGLFQGVVLTTTIEFFRRKELVLKYAYFMLSFLILMYLACASTFAVKFNYAIFWVASISLILTTWLFFWHKRGRIIYIEHKYTSHQEANSTAEKQPPVL